MTAPSQTAAASSKLMPSGLCASAPALWDADELRVRTPFDAEDLVTDRELAHGRRRLPRPLRRAPCRGIRLFGRRSPVNTRAKNGSAARKPQSDRVTVVEWTLTRTSCSFGTGRSTSSSRRTSGGPYESWTTALMKLTSSRRCVARGGSGRRGPRPVPRGRARRAARRRNQAVLGARSGSPSRPRRGCCA